MQMGKTSLLLGKANRQIRTKSVLFFVAVPKHRECSSVGYELCVKRSPRPVNAHILSPTRVKEGT
jgi:hypothetical protein